MEIGTFGTLVTINRHAFRYILDNNLDVVYYEEGKLINIKDWILNVCLESCCSDFEEQTMVENLKEEFEDFIKEILGE